MPVIDRIKVRRGTAAQWTAANPVLHDGEPGFERDTGLMKVGNGQLAWNSLPYTATKGPKGDTGATGPAGPAGATGPAGPQGSPGVPFQVLTADPASPAAGFAYYNSTTDTLRIYNGTAWRSVATTA